MVGEVFGRITIVELLPEGYALCRCECGTVKRISRTNLRSGRVKSCGCLRREKYRGYTKLPEYYVWQSMLSRCKDQNNDRYGGRGIVVEYANFEAFYTDVGSRPSPSHSIDRIDNDGNYASGNCKWSTSTEQSRNQSTNDLITWNGKTQCLSAWAEELGIDRRTVYSRLTRDGWTVEKAFTKRVRTAKNFTWQGKTQTVSEWSRETGIHKKTLSARLFAYGWDIERALTTPT